LYRGGPQPRRHCVRWGPSSPSPKGAQPPIFWDMSLVAKRLDGLRCHLVWRYASPRQLRLRWGPSSPTRKKGHSPEFLAHELWPNRWMDQDAIWYGTEVNLGPGDVVLDGVPTPPKRGIAPPVFGPCLLWPRSPFSATAELLYMSAAVAEMGDRGHNIHGPKESEESAVPLSRGSWVPV